MGESSTESGSGDSVAAFRQARDFLLRHRDDPRPRAATSAGPQLDRFNWALDYFDPMARGNDAPALWIVDEERQRGGPFVSRAGGALDPGRQLPARARRRGAATASC